MMSSGKPFSFKFAIGLAAVAAALVAYTDSAQAQSAFNMRGLTATSTMQEVKASFPLIAGDCYSDKCDISETWMASIGGKKVKRRMVHYHYKTGKLESVELIAEIGQWITPDLNSADRTAIRAALTKHFGQPCEVQADDGMFGHVSWCFSDGTLTETAWGEFESRILFTPSTPAQRAADANRREQLAKSDF